MVGMKKLLYAMLALLCLGGCMVAHTDMPLEDTPSSSVTETEQSVPDKQQTPDSQEFTPYQAPEFARADFDHASAHGENGVLIDLSGISMGYVAVSAESDVRMKFRVEMGEQIYDYDLPSDGTPAVYPLQCGNGSYIFRALANTVGTKYAEAYCVETQVRLKDDFQPFLRPSQYADYDEDSI